MSKATFVVHQDDYEHATESDWSETLRLLNEEAKRLGYEPVWMHSVYRAVADLAGANVVARLDVTDANKPVVINVTAGNINIVTKDEPTKGP